MPERRTTVTVDIQAGNIDLGDGDITIPVTLDPEGGGGGGGPGGGGTGGGGSNWQDAFQRTFGTAVTARILAFFTQLGPLLANAAKNFPLLAVAIGAVAAKFAVLYVQAKLALFILKQLGKAGLWALQQLYEGAKKAATAFIDLAKTAIQMSVEALKRFSQAVVDVGKAVAQHIVSFLKTSVGMFSKFEQAIANAVAATGLFGDAADDMRKRVMQAAKDVTTTVGTMAWEAAEAFGQMVRAGRTVAEAFNMLAPAVALAEATLENMHLTTKTLNATMNQYAIGADQAARVTDTLVAATFGAPGLIKDIGDALKYAGSSASMLGISLEDTLAMIMGLERQGREGSRAGMELQNVLKSLIAPTDKAREVFGKLGVDVDRLANNIITKGMIPALKELEGLGGRLTAAFGDDEGMGYLAQTLMSAETMRAGRGLAGLLMEGVDSLEKMSKQVTSTNDGMTDFTAITQQAVDMLTGANKAAGGLGSAWRTMGKDAAGVGDAVSATGIAVRVQVEQLRTLDGAWRRLKSIWEEVYYDLLGNKLAPALGVVVLRLDELVKSARGVEFFEKFGEALLGLPAIVDKLIVALGPRLLDALQGIVKLLPEAITQIATAVTKLMPTVISAIEQLPMVMSQVIGQLLPMLVRFATTVGPLLLDFAMKVIPLLISMFTKFGGILTSFLAKNGDQLVAWFGFLLATGLKLLGFLPSVIPLFEKLVGVFMKWGPYLVDVAMSLLPQFPGIIQRLLPILGQLAATVLPMVVTALGQIAAIIKQQGIGAFQEFIGLVLKLAETAMQALPFVVSIVKKAMWVIGMLLKVAGQDWDKFGTGIVGILKWLDDNFYVIIGSIIDIVSGFLDTLERLLNLAAVLAPILGRLTRPLIVLLGIFGLLEAAVLALSTALFWIVKALDALGLIPDVPTAWMDKWSDFNSRMKSDLGDTWDAMKTLGKGPAALKAGLNGARDAVGDFKDIWDQTGASIDDALKKQEGAGGGGASPGGGPGGRSNPHFPYGDGGPSLAPAAGTFNINFNGPDWDEVNSQWQAYYDKQKQAEADAYRTRAPGYSPA